MPDQESSTIIRGIVDGWIHRHGPPDYMISDQGPNVDGIEVRRTLEKYGIVKKRSSPYHPEGDGQSERGIQAVKLIMRCLLQEKEIEIDSWPTLIPQVCYILNSIASTSTGFTPYRIMYGVEPKSLGVAGLDLETENHYYSFLEWTKELQELEGMVNEEVEENLGTARAKMKRAYDIGKCESTAKAGDLVLVRNHSRRSGLDQ